MKRRQLVAVTASLAVAGCLGSASRERDKPPTTVDATVTDSTLATRETASGRLETAVTGTVENTGTARLGLVNVAGAFFDAEGQLLAWSERGVCDLEPGDVWEPWIACTGEENVDRTELTVTTAVAHDRIISPDGVVLESHGLQLPAADHTMPRLLGTVVNRSDADISTLQARLKLIAANGNLLETALASVRNLGAGVMWKFDQRIHFTNPAWTDRIDDHQVVLTM